MEIRRQVLNVEQIEDALCQIGDVKAARLVTGPNDTIEEIHVLASPAKGAKQLVRDIESLLMARFGLPVNHRKISVAQIGTPDLNHTSPRPKIGTVNTQVSGVRARISVSLELADRCYEGLAEGPASQTGRERLVALAALDAIAKFVSGGCVLALEDIAVLTLGRERVAVACVSVIGPGGEQVLSGSAPVKQNDNDSIIRATLDAINRRFGFLTTT